jgi:N-acetylmuramoyl-L-alanine amidase
MIGGGGPAGIVWALARLLVLLCLGLAGLIGTGQGAIGQGATGQGLVPPLSALARVNPGESGLRDLARGVVLDLGLSQAVPYRIAHLDAPRRVAIEFREVIWDGPALAAIPPTSRVVAVRASVPRPGWSRLELTLAAPLAVSEASMATDAASGSARLHLRLAPVTAAVFAQRVADSVTVLPDDRRIVTVPAPKPGRASGAPLVVALDPGHGGIDPGAERDGMREADLVLAFARDLAEALTRHGGFRPVLTRPEDVFVSLEGRIRLAHEAGANLFISLHADALEGGGASGATVYTLSDSASDKASALLAERHDRADLLAGVDLTGHDDRIADVLMDLARRETDPRTDRLARAIVTALAASGTPMHSRPLRKAAFSVLKAPDIPSVLLELGFLSNPADRENLLDAGWRARIAGALVDALDRWQRDEVVGRPTSGPD